MDLSSESLDDLKWPEANPDVYYMPVTRAQFLKIKHQQKLIKHLEKDNERLRDEQLKEAVRRTSNRKGRGYSRIRGRPL